MSQTINELLVELDHEPYTRERYDADFARVLARLCEKHGVTTHAEVRQIIREHRYAHSGEDPEQDYIELMALARSTGWGDRFTLAMDICDACRRIIERGTKPTLPEVRPLIDEYYALPGNGAGGGLHIVLDDGNYERGNVQYCIDRASDEETRQLGLVLLMLSNSQRRRM